MKYTHNTHNGLPSPLPLLFFSLLLPLLAIRDTRQSYQLAQGHTYQRQVTLQQDMRYTFVQTEGQSKLTVKTTLGDTIANHE